MKSFFTSESVTEGHPDKMCDQIADAVLDGILVQDKNARVACEVLASTGIVFVAGEITTNCYIDVEATARKTINEIGYNGFGFSHDTCAVVTALKAQSADIALGVDDPLETRGEGENALGAGDQGIMFGYACDETPVLMPAPIYTAHIVAKRLAETRKSGELKYLRPDGKTQITFEYDGDRPVRVDTVVVSTQHDETVKQQTIRGDVIERVIKHSIPEHLLDANVKYFVNPTGRFVVGGPVGDCGLTGRKIIVDTYGGAARHGGGAFSGKDPTKVDRSASYMARYIAKNIVASGVAKRCEVQLAYAIGVTAPVSIYVNTFGTGKLPDDKITNIVSNNFDTSPKAIIDLFDLRRPIYRQIAAYGHFGREDVDLPWEKTDKKQLFM
jgi:S-adenosylmethionine synthetase